MPHRVFATIADFRTSHAVGISVNNQVEQHCRAGCRASERCSISIKTLNDVRILTIMLAQRVRLRSS
jgi:hypothetical protein